MNTQQTEKQRRREARRQQWQLARTVLLTYLAWCALVIVLALAMGARW